MPRLSRKDGLPHPSLHERDVGPTETNKLQGAFKKGAWALKGLLCNRRLQRGFSFASSGDATLISRASAVYLVEVEGVGLLLALR